MNEVTELVIIIDKSGSMDGLEKDVIGGYNALIKEQGKLGGCKVTTIFFNDHVDFIYEQEDIAKVEKLDSRSYRPSGCTALLDAIGDAIAFIKEKHAKLDIEDIPAHTIFSIMTDGLENASREYSYKRIKDMIEKQKKCGWEFLFQAANIDTYAEAERIGIDKHSACSFDTTPSGVINMMECCSNMIMNSRMKKKKK